MKRKIYLLILFYFFITYRLEARKIIFSNNFFNNDKDLINLVSSLSNENISYIKNKVDEYFLLKGYTLTYVKKIIKNNKIIYIYLHPGIISKIKISGNYKISKNILRIYIKIRVGDIFNENILKVQLKKLKSTGIFEKVTYKVLKGRYRNILFINIEEKKELYLKFNGSFNMQYGIMPLLSFYKRNIYKKPFNFNLNGEIGFWDKLTFFRYQFNIKYYNYHFLYNHRNGLLYIGENSMNLNDITIKNSLLLYNYKYYFLKLIFLINYLTYKNYEYFIKYKIINGLRNGLILLLNLDNERNIFDNIYLKKFNIKNSLFYLKNKFYFKSVVKISYPFSITPYLIFRFRNFTGITSSEAPLDMLFYLQKDYQSGYYEGTFISNFECDNNFIFYYHIIYNSFINIFSFNNTFYKEDNIIKKLNSISEGIILKLFGFKIKLLYSIPFKREFITAGIIKEDLLSGLISINISKTFSD